MILTTHFVQNSSEEDVKYWCKQTLCQIKLREIQIAQHQYNLQNMLQEITYVNTSNIKNDSD